MKESWRLQNELVRLNLDTNSKYRNSYRYRYIPSDVYNMYLLLFQLKKQKQWQPSSNKHTSHSEKWEVCVQSCPALCDPMDCSLPGSSAHGILQARTLEWVTIFYSREFSQPGDRTSISCVSCAGRRILYHCATWEALGCWCLMLASNTIF